MTLMTRTFAIVLCSCLLATATYGQPRYQVDASWPAALPNNWILGQVAGIAVDRQQHVWIVQRPRSLSASEAGAVQDPPLAACCVPAPSVLEFDQQGRLVQAWGGPIWQQDSQSWQLPDGDWPGNEHGIFVDDEGFVWLAGNGPEDSQIFKFRRDGSHVLTIGRPGGSGGSNDGTRLGRPADMVVDGAAREVYVADGYGNRRLIVFDSDTGAYKRHWGAYGGQPDDLACVPGMARN
ncbi:MAG: hypothetical protein RQ899_15245 [Pseudomonadales bacterium]|nr:hypothetical protein [Pseudomonadales bacterium]